MNLIDLFPNPATSNNSNGMVITSSGYYLSNYAYNVFDKSYNTGWVSSTMAGYIQVIFNEKKSVYQIKIECSCSSTITIEYTEDKSNWYTLGMYDLGSGTDYSYRSVIININKSIYGIRFSASSSSQGNNYFTLNEITFYKLALKYLMQDGNNLCNTTGTDLNVKGTLPYTIDIFNNYGMQNLNDITSDTISLLNNLKFNISMLK